MNFLTLAVTAEAGAPPTNLASSFGSGSFTTYTESSIWTLSNGQLIRKSYTSFQMLTANLSRLYTSASWIEPDGCTSLTVGYCSIIVLTAMQPQYQWQFSTIAELLRSFLRPCQPMVCLAL